METVKRPMAFEPPSEGISCVKRQRCCGTVHVHTVNDQPTSPHNDAAVITLSETVAADPRLLYNTSKEDSASPLHFNDPENPFSDYESFPELAVEDPPLAQAAADPASGGKIHHQPFPAVETRLAHCVGPCEPALLNETIGARFASVVRDFPDSVAVKTENEHLTYKQLDAASDACAIGLQKKLGVSAGDRVAVSMGTCIPHFVIIYACFKLGAIIVTLNPAYSPEQAVAAVQHTTASCYITSSHVTLPYKQPKSTKPVLDHIVDSNVFGLGRIIVVNNEPDQTPFNTPYGVVDFDWLVSCYKGRELPLQKNLRPQDVINLQFTSGTTSSPKAVSLTHWGMLNNAHICNRLYETTADDIAVCITPLHHCIGLVLVMLNLMLSAACIAIPSESFNAPRAMRTLVRERCTMLHGVPTMLHALVRLSSDPEFASHNFSMHLRTGLTGGAAMPQTLRTQLNARMHAHDLRNVFGMTELSGLLTVSLPTDPLPRRYSTVGRAVPHTAIRIVARDDPTRTLRVGERGEVLGTGMVMQSYWRDSVRSAEALIALPDPDDASTARVWLRTGDEGMLDEDGYLTITGRIKDIIIRGGENIYPAEIEDVLLAHHCVEDVAVVSIPDEVYGELVGAFVVPSADAQVLHDGVRDRETFDLRTTATEAAVAMSRGLINGFDDNGIGGAVAEGLTGGDVRAAVLAKLSKHLLPKFVFWVDRLPTTASGKIEKFKLRKMGSDAVAAASVAGAAAAAAVIATT